jgi:hypothetical protein
MSPVCFEADKPGLKRTLRRIVGYLSAHPLDFILSLVHSMLLLLKNVRPDLDHNRWGDIETTCQFRFYYLTFQIK